MQRHTSRCADKVVYCCIEMIGTNIIDLNRLDLFFRSRSKSCYVQSAKWALRLRCIGIADTFRYRDVVWSYSSHGQCGHMDQLIDANPHRRRRRCVSSLHLSAGDRRASCDRQRKWRHFPRSRQLWFDHYSVSTLINAEELAFSCVPALCDHSHANPMTDSHVRIHRCAVLDVFWIFNTCRHMLST